jgi:hypothetical protein
MIVDRQAKRLWTALSLEETFAPSWDKAEMDEKTAAVRYNDGTLGRLIQTAMCGLTSLHRAFILVAAPLR